MKKRVNNKDLRVLRSRRAYVWEGPPSHLVVEEVHGVVVELEGQRLQEGDVIGHDLLIGEVELVDDNGVHVVVRQQVIWAKGRGWRRERL